MATNKYSDLLEGLNTASSTSGGGRYDDLYLDLLSEEERKRREYRFQYANPAEVGPPTPESGGVARLAEAAGTGILDQLQQAGGFLGGTVVDPIQNAIEWAEAGLVGREPRYRNRLQESQQISENLRQGLGEMSTAEQIAFGGGSAVGMIPETLAGGGLLRQGSRAGAALLNEGAETAAEFALRQTREGVQATSLLAPRLGAQTAAEAEAAGATPFEATLAGAADTLGTALTAGLPISARGTLAQRAATGAVGGLGAEAGASAAVTPFLPEELRAQRDILAPENATMAAVLGAGMGAAFGTRPAPRVSDAARDLAAMRDAEVARGIEAAQQQDSVRQAEEAIAELNKLTDRALSRNKGDTSPLFGESAYPRVEEPAPVQEAITFPEQAPLQRDIFGNEVEARVMTPPSEIEAQAADLEAKARTVRETTTAIDDRIDALVEQKAQIVPTGPRGGYTRADRVAIDRFDRQILDLQARKRELETGAVNIEAAATSARLDLPSEATRSEAEVRQDYLLTMQGRQFDQAERARLGEMEAQGEGATPDLFQPTKPRVRAELEPEQGTLPLPKPRIRVGESLEQQGPALPQSEAPRPVQAPLEGPTMELPFSQPKRQGATRDLSAEAEGPAREAQRLGDARKVYVQDLNTAKSDLTKARNEVTKFTKEDQPVPQDVLDRAEAASLRVREAEFTLGRFDRLSKRDQAKGGTTPAPRTQTTPVEAPTRAERVAARTVAEQVVDPVTGQAETVVEPAVSPDDARRRELEKFFSQPRAEPLSGTELNNAQQADIQAVQADPQANVVPAEARAPSVFEKKLAGVSNARGAMKVIRSMVIPDSPFVKILDALDKSPFLNDVPVVVVQPGDRMPRAMESPTVRGILQPYVGGKNAVFLRGSGYRLNGTQTPEITLHEIVHAASVDLIDGVDKGRIKDPKAIVAVKQIDTIRQELAKALQDKETREGLTGSEKVNLDYATKNSKEFVSQALSSSAMQSGLKKENLWSRFVNGIRNLFRGPRSTAPLWDKIVDASLSVVETQTELEATVRASRAPAELEPGARRADSLELEDADAADIRDTSAEDARRQVLGQDRTVTSRLASKLSPFSKSGMIARKLDYTLSRIFFSERGSNRTVEEVMGYKQGVVERINAEAAPFVNRLRALLKSVPVRNREQAAREIDSILKGDLKIEDAKFVRPEFGPSINQVRDTIDKFTIEIGQEVQKAYAGRDMPKSTLNLLGTLKANLGSYVSRTYLSDSDNMFASDLWGRYKKGDERAVEIVQPLINKLSMEIASLPETLRQAREEAQALSDSRVEVLPEDTFLGSELRRLYENYIGSSVGRTKEDMLQALTRFSNQAKDVKSEAERVTQEIMGVGKATSALAQYYRGLRSNDQPLRKRSAVPKEIRDVWGEITDPLLNAINTTQRMGALLSGLRASNMLAEQAPDVFTDRYNADSGQTFEVPNNPLAYGQLAGKYTDEGTFNLVVGQNEMVSSLLYGKPLDAGKFGAGAGRLAAETIAKATAYQKMASIVLNPFVAASNVFNMAYMPLVNGNTDATLLPEAVRVASKMLGSANRFDEADPTLLEILEQGIIDPVLTQADNVIRQRTKEARTLRKEGVALDKLSNSKKVALDTFDTLKEGISFLETLPKIWNYLSHKKTFREMFPDLSDTEIKRLAAEETNRLNLTYARVPDVVRMTETAGISYVAGYMQQILATSVYSLSSGSRQAIEGIRSGNKKLAMFGLKKIGGSVAGYALASYIPMFVAEAMGWVDLSEDDEDKQALLDTLAFTERGMQPVMMGINPDGVLTHADLGRLNPYDSTHSVLRALASASSAVAKGENEKAEANLKAALENLGGQFFGGSPIGGLILRGVQGKAPPSAMEADAKKLHDSIVLMGQTVGLSETATSNLLNVAWTFNPAALRGVARGAQLEQTNPEAFSDNLVAGATFMRAPVRTHDPFNNLARVAQFEYKPAVNRDDLRKVLLLEGDVSRERIQDTVSRLVDSEAEAFNDLVTGVRAARYAGRLAGMPESQVANRIRESLEAGGIAKSKARAFVQETVPYEPTLIGNDWGKEAIQTYLRGLPSREYRTKRERELNERLRLIQDVVKEAQPRRRVTTTN